MDAAYNIGAGTCPDPCGGGTDGAGGCAAGELEDCDGSGECWPQTWVGDGYCDGEDQAFGADLSQSLIHI